MVTLTKRTGERKKKKEFDTSLHVAENVFVSRDYYIAQNACTLFLLPQSCLVTAFWRASSL